MAKNSCELYPMVKGKRSQLYFDFLKKTGDRPLTNLIYASYLQSGVAAQMDSKGYKQNSQGQHNANDVYEFFNVSAMTKETTGMGLLNITKAVGATDHLGNLIDHNSAKNALDIASNVNNNYNGVVATVLQHRDKFNVLVTKKDSRTQIRANDVRKQQQVWDVVGQALSTIGVDINSPEFNSEYINALKGRDFVDWLNRVQVSRNNVLSLWEIEALLRINDGTSQVNRLKSMFGTLGEVAQRIYDSYRGTSVTSAQRTLIEATLNRSRNFKGLDISGLAQQVAQIEQAMLSTPEASIDATLKGLNKKYNIDFNELHRIGNEIRTLTEAAEDAAFTLKRQLNKIKAEQGINPESKRIEAALRTLTREIANNKYYAGILGFLNEASVQINNMQAMLSNIPQTGSRMEIVAATARVLMEVKAINDGYYNILNALTNIDQLVSEENISDIDKQTITAQATNLMQFFKSHENLVKNLSEDNMIQLATEYLGDKLENGMDIAHAVTMAEADSTIYDFLYSVGRVSNPLMATMGAIIRDAQDERDLKLVEYAKRIRKAEHRLRKAGVTSDFMYEDSGYIISDIDWVLYNKARSKARGAAKMRGLKGLSLEEAMQAWEEANTEERVVDNVSGRTERVPNASYRKEFPKLTSAQQEYYDTMMQIKGEIGTILPEYAQRQYMPPQVRRSFVDAWKSSKSIKDYLRAIKNKIQDLYTIREDDEFHAANGIIDGEEYGITSGALDNTPYRQIPIFYVNRIKDQRELLLDFSSALQHLAGTAVNYKAMHNIKDTVEFMGDYIKSRRSVAMKGNKTKLAEIIDDIGVRIFKDLYSKAKNNRSSTLIDSFIDKHIYGVSIQGYNKKTKLLRSLLAYTSIRSLAVNVKGALSNYVVGELQMLIEAGAGEFYNTVDYLWANAKVFGDNTVNAPGRIMDFFTNNENSKSVLLAQLFNPLNENFGTLSHKRYHRGIMRQLVGHDFTFMGYGAGEHMIHYVTMYAVLHNMKVKVNGKDTNLYDIFYVGNKEDGNSELLYKDATYINDEGVEVPVDAAYFDMVKKRIRYANQNTHGSMNEEDKGIVHQYMLGRFVMNLRQWMVEHYSRRYRSRYWDATLKEEREGFYRTVWDKRNEVHKLLYGWVSDIIGFQNEAALQWNNLSKMQRSNIKRVLQEQVVLACLLTLSFALGEPEDHKKEFWMRMWIYQTKRAIVDVLGSTPYGIPTEMNTLINNPIAATSTVNALLYPFTGIGDITDTIKSGRHKGENRYLRNLEKYWLPFSKQIEEIQNFDEDEGVFAVFNKKNL